LILSNAVNSDKLPEEKTNIHYAVIWQWSGSNIKLFINWWSGNTSYWTSPLYKTKQEWVWW